MFQPGRGAGLALRDWPHRHAAAATGALEDLAAAAGYRAESSGQLPLLRYVLAIRPAC